MSEPILGYELIIDTGNHPPICAKQPQYGIHKSFIMDKHIFLFIQKLWIIQDRSSPWAAKISLSPKPHQEHIFSMKDYEWRFCINYCTLNLVTRPVQFPIPNCNDAVFDSFGNSRLFFLFDASLGYHQFKHHDPVFMVQHTNQFNDVISVRFRRI